MRTRDGRGVENESEGWGEWRRVVEMLGKQPHPGFRDRGEQHQQLYFRVSNISTTELSAINRVGAYNFPQFSRNCSYVTTTNMVT